MADPIAAQCTAGITHSAEPTYGSTFWVDIGINQRGSKADKFDAGRELVGAATASNGIGSKMATAAFAIQATCIMRWVE